MVLKKKCIPNRRELIIEASSRLFKCFGYEKTTLDDIAKEVGITRTLIYLEFPSKEDLLLSTIEQLIQQIISHMREVAQQPDLPKLVKLKSVILCNITLAYDCSSQHFCPVTIGTVTQRIRNEMGHLLQQKQQILHQLLKEAVEAAELPLETDCETVTALLSHALYSFLPPNNLNYSREELERNASLLFDLVLAGLALPISARRI